jgi:phosphoribosylformylglycinamidine synthase
MVMYRALSKAIAADLVASAHGIYRGGLGVHLAMVAMGGQLGMDVDLANVPVDNVRRDDTVLYSESAGRFIVTIDPRYQEPFEAFFQGMPMACIGRMTEEQIVTMKGLDGRKILQLTVPALKTAWHQPFGDLI